MCENKGEKHPVTPDLTVAIIGTNNRQQLRDCLDALFTATHCTDLEVFVVDNASTDGTAEMLAQNYPQAQVIRNVTRLGFASNNNLVLARAHGRYVLLLNDDTQVLDSAIDRMVAFMDAHPEAAVAGGQLLNPDGSVQICFCTFPKPMLEALHPLTDRWRVVQAVSSEPFVVDWVSGACLIVRGEVIAEVGGLDPAFDPIYSEETDWCYRIHQHGGLIFALPDARVIHFGGQTMNRLPARRVELLYGKRALYFRKHQGAVAASTFKITLWLASLTKLLYWITAWPFARAAACTKVALHWHMVRRALRL